MLFVFASIVGIGGGFVYEGEYNYSAKCTKYNYDIFLDRRRIHEFLFHESPYDPDTSPILNHTHQHPVEVDVWIEIHTINEGFSYYFEI